MRFLYILEINPFSVTLLQKISPNFFNGFLGCAKLLSIIRLYLFIFVFIFITVGSGSKKILLEFMSKSIPVDAGTDIDKAQALLEQARGR